MKKKSMKLSLRLLLVLMSITMIAQSVLAANTAEVGEYDDWGKYMGAGSVHSHCVVQKIGTVYTTARRVG